MMSPAPMNLLQMMTAAYVPHMLYVVATLGIADHLADGSQSITTLAQQTNTHPASLERVLRALASVGVFFEESDGTWSLTSLADGLRTAAPASQRAWVQLYGGIYQRA